MSEENNIPAAEVDIEPEAQIILDKIRGLFRKNMYFLLIVPGLVIQFTAGARMGPFFVLAAIPLPVLMAMDLGLLVNNCQALKKCNKINKTCLARLANRLFF